MRTHAHTYTHTYTHTHTVTQPTKSTMMSGDTRTHTHTHTQTHMHTNTHTHKHTLTQPTRGTMILGTDTQPLAFAERAASKIPRACCRAYVCHDSFVCEKEISYVRKGSCTIQIHNHPPPIKTAYPAATERNSKAGKHEKKKQTCMAEISGKTTPKRQPRKPNIGFTSDNLFSLSRTASLLIECSVCMCVYWRVSVCILRNDPRKQTLGIPSNNPSLRVCE